MEHEAHSQRGHFNIGRKFGLERGHKESCLQEQESDWNLVYITLFVRVCPSVTRPGILLNGTNLDWISVCELITVIGKSCDIAKRVDGPNHGGSMARYRKPSGAGPW